jgi:uncharacterized protein (TIGR02231 family)
VGVTFYEDRAEVVRERAVSLVAGPQWVKLGGVTPLLSDATVQASVTVSGARVITARVVRQVLLSTELGFEEIQALEESAREATEVAKRASRAAGRAGAAQARTNSLFREWVHTFSTVPETSEFGGYEHWREAYCATQDAHCELLGQWHDETAKREDAEVIKRRAEARLAQGQAQKPRVQAAIEVLVEAESAGEGTVQVRYRTPCALWRPEYIARLGEPGEDGEAELEIVLYGTAWQRTGEVWDDVKASFSTARPAEASSPPLLSEDVLTKRRKSSEERREVQVSVRETKVSVAGLGADAAAVHQVPGVDDGGEPQVYAPDSPVTFKSDGEPLRAEMRRFNVPVSTRRILVPEVQGVAHVVVSGTMNEGPLLAGPSQIVRGGGFIGRTEMKFIAPGERFEMGFGPDDAIRCRRHRREERDTTPVIGTQKVARTVTLYLSNVSGVAKTVEVKERVPVSEIEDVTIELTAVDAWTFDAKQGFLTRTFDLPPRAVESWEIGYEIRAKSNVRLPF